MIIIRNTLIVDNPKNIPTRNTYLELIISLKLPIPTFLIPLAFVRWVFTKLVKLVYPKLIELNERFDELPFADRYRKDADGFYARLKETINTKWRPYQSREGPRFPL